VIATIVRCGREKLEFTYIPRHAACSSINLKHVLLLICILSFDITLGTLLAWIPSTHEARFSTVSQMPFQVVPQDLAPCHPDVDQTPSGCDWMP